MATRDTSAQFQEPPVAELPGATNTSTTEESNIDAQFQEPISPQTSAKPTSFTEDGGALHKSTTEKLKDAVKNPFSNVEETETTDETEMMGHKRITSPEMAAANEVLKVKGLKSP